MEPKVGAKQSRPAGYHGYPAAMQARKVRAVFGIQIAALVLAISIPSARITALN